MANKYPSNFVILEPMLPLVRRALIHEMDRLREDMPTHLSFNRWQCAFDNLNDLKIIDDFLKELDSHIQFDDHEECPF